MTEKEDYGRLIASVASSRDREAFARLFAHFAPRLKSYLMRSGAGAAAAEDFAQDAMLNVWRKAALYDPARASPSSWVFAIARNLRIDALRREQRRTFVLDASDEPDSLPPADAIMADQETAQRVLAVLETLPPDQQKVIRLSFFYDMAHAEIAQQLGLPLGTVKSRLRLALGKLRAALEVSP